MPCGLCLVVQHSSLRVARPCPTASLLVSHMPHHALPQAMQRAGMHPSPRLWLSLMRVNLAADAPQQVHLTALLAML